MHLVVATSLNRSRAVTVLPDTASPDPSDAIAERDRARRLLGSLPRIQRAVLVLRYFEDLSVRETARELNLPEGTVKSHASRALAQLRLDVSDIDANANGVNQ